MYLFTPKLPSHPGCTPFNVLHFKENFDFWFSSTFSASKVERLEMFPIAKALSLFGKTSVINSDPSVWTTACSM